MLIIFDLDDTLIETSRFVTPYKFTEVVKKMGKEGLDVYPLHEAIAEIKEIDSSCQNSIETIKIFIQRKKGFSHHKDIALKELFKKLPKHFSFLENNEIKKILKDLQEAHILYLVSKGKKNLQYDKLKKAGIDCSLFSNIVIIEKGNKKDCYKKIIEEKQIPLQEGIVCGDRIFGDLIPAKELGFWTVHMRRGRGEKEKPHPFVDFTIYSLKDIKKILIKLQERM